VAKTNIFYTTDKLRHHDAEGKLDVDVIWKVVDYGLSRYVKRLTSQRFQNLQAELTPSMILELRTAAHAGEFLGKLTDDIIEFCDNALKVFSDNSRVFVICC
jgi:hypothetical protein